MQMHVLPQGVTLLDDSYKGAVESVYAAIDAFAALPGERKIVVFGGVDEPPGRQGDVNREIGRRLGAVADVLLCLKTGLTGVRAGAVEAGLKREVVHLLAPDFRLAVDWLERELRPGDAVLIKGQSALCLRRVALRLKGRRFSCSVASCKVKVPSCEVCPLLDASPEVLRNHFVARYVRE
jgi:UDP-N-acetylmuramyl pentapeptide synthase